MKTLVIFYLGTMIGSLLNSLVDHFPEQALFSSNISWKNELLNIVIPITSKHNWQCCWHIGLKISCGLGLVAYYHDWISFWQLYFILFSMTLSLYDMREQSYPLLIWIMGSLPLFVTFGLQPLSLIFLLLAILAEYRFIKMGSGDFLYLASMSLLLDSYHLFWGIQISCLIAILYILAKSLQQEPIPFVPFLAFGYLATIFI